MIDVDDSGVGQRSALAAALKSSAPDGGSKKRKMLAKLSASYGGAGAYGGPGPIGAIGAGRGRGAGSPKGGKGAKLPALSPNGNAKEGGLFLTSINGDGEDAAENNAEPEGGSADGAAEGGGGPKSAEAPKPSATWAKPQKKAATAKATWGARLPPIKKQGGPGPAAYSIDSPRDARNKRVTGGTFGHPPTKARKPGGVPPEVCMR